MAFSRTTAALAAILCFVGSVVAAPTPVEIEARDIDQTTLSNLKLYSQFCTAAYCGANNNQKNVPTKITCASGNCPLVQSSNVTSILEFENSFFTDVTGYAAVDHTRNLIVLAFRGSKSLQNWLADVDVKLAQTNICGSCKATQGFYGSWLEARSQVLPALKTAAALYPSYPLTVTGHSLGGAIATIAAADIRNQHYTSAPVDLYTYGSPRVGTSGFADFITAQPGGKEYRATHHDDPVPRLPPYTLGFRHVDPEYFIDTQNGQAVTAANVKVINVKTQGNGVGDDGAFNPFNADLDAHGDYLGPISACG